MPPFAQCYSKVSGKCELCRRDGNVNTLVEKNLVVCIKQTEKIDDGKRDILMRVFQKPEFKELDQMEEESHY